MASQVIHGQWEDSLDVIGEVDAVITDPPYSSRTHDGHDDGASLANRAGKGWVRANGKTDGFRPRREISYTNWTAEDVHAFVAALVPRNRGWFVCLSDSVLCETYRDAYEANGLTGFAPVGILIPGMTVRMAGDGPSSWMLYANVARPKRLSKWGTLPGGYTGNQGERLHIGGKPEWLMRALVRDYTKRNDLVFDPCAGAGTTLLAAEIEGRRSVGCEVNKETYEVARKRLDKPTEMTFNFAAAVGEG